MSDLIAAVATGWVRSGIGIVRMSGSGCIAASLALALPGAEVCAADLSDAALAIAAENFRTLGARVTLRKADSKAMKEMAATLREMTGVVRDLYGMPAPAAEGAKKAKDEDEPQSGVILLG